jgi:hypothetical protein
MDCFFLSPLPALQVLQCRMLPRCSYVSWSQTAIHSCNPAALDTMSCQRHWPKNCKAAAAAECRHAAPADRCAVPCLCLIQLGTSAQPKAATAGACSATCYGNVPQTLLCNDVQCSCKFCACWELSTHHLHLLARQCSSYCRFCTIRCRRCCRSVNAAAPSPIPTLCGTLLCMHIKIG